LDDRHVTITGKGKKSHTEMRACDLITFYCETLHSTLAALTSLGHVTPL